MTKQIELPSGRYLLVKVPKDKSYFDLYGGNTPNSIEYNTMPKPGKFKRESIKLTEGHTYTLIGGSNWQAKKEDEKKPLYENKSIDPEHLSIDQPAESGYLKDIETTKGYIDIGQAEPLKPDDHMTMIEMLNWYDEMRKKKYEPSFILKQLISRYSIARK